ncbi:MAG: DUF3696 domain-containing protein [Polyangiaceae bacterium]
MLKRWTLENFKPIRERLDLPLAPLTVLAGLNSSGKSSFLQSILLVAQTLQNQAMDEPLILNGPLVRLGTYQDTCNERLQGTQISIGFELSVLIPISTPPVVLTSGKRSTSDGHITIFLDAHFDSTTPTSDEARASATRAVVEDVSVSVSIADHESPQTIPDIRITAKRVPADVMESFKTALPENVGRFIPARPQNHLAQMGAPAFSEERTVGVARWAHFIPTAFVGTASWGQVERDIFSYFSFAEQEILSSFTRTLRYLGPLRAEPDLVQSFSTSGQPDDVGTKGEHAAAVFAANRQQVILFFDPISKGLRKAHFEEAMDTWLRYLGVAEHVNTQAGSVPNVSWVVRSAPENKERPLSAVGVGVSQVLPILVAGLLSPPDAILIMEQPELHLHERPQARLADFFYGLTRVGKQVFIETHSAVLIGQLRYLMVKGGQEARDATAIYFVTQDEQGDAKFEPIRISKRGAVENWPDGFFDESYRQEDLITEEGMRAGGGTRGHA